MAEFSELVRRLTESSNYLGASSRGHDKIHLYNQSLKRIGFNGEGTITLSSWLDLTKELTDPGSSVLKSNMPQ